MQNLLVVGFNHALKLFPYQKGYIVWVMSDSLLLWTLFHHSQHCFSPASFRALSFLYVFNVFFFTYATLRLSTDITPVRSAQSTYVWLVLTFRFTSDVALRPTVRPLVHSTSGAQTAQLYLNNVPSYIFPELYILCCFIFLQMFQNFWSNYVVFRSLGLVHVNVVVLLSP